MGPQRFTVVNVLLVAVFANGVDFVSGTVYDVYIDEGFQGNFKVNVTKQDKLQVGILQVYSDEDKVLRSIYPVITNKTIISIESKKKVRRHFTNLGAVVINTHTRLFKRTKYHILKVKFSEVRMGDNSISAEDTENSLSSASCVESILPDDVEQYFVYLCSDYDEDPKIFIAHFRAAGKVFTVPPAQTGSFAVDIKNGISHIDEFGKGRQLKEYTFMYIQQCVSKNPNFAGVDWQLLYGVGNTDQLNTFKYTSIRPNIYLPVCKVRFAHDDGLYFGVLSNNDGAHQLHLRQVYANGYTNGVNLDDLFKQIKVGMRHQKTEPYVWLEPITFPDISDVETDAPQAIFIDAIMPFTMPGEDMEYVVSYGVHKTDRI